MSNIKYSDYIELSPTFESVVDIDTDTRNQNLWREYIVGDDMESLMQVLCQSLNKEEPDSRRSFWIEGNYGTGKSYAAIMLKHLMEEKPEIVSDFMSKNSRLAQYRNRFMKARNNRPDYLVIWKTACTGIRDGNALLMELEKAVRDALAAKFGDAADYGDISLQDSVLQQVNSPLHNWDYIIQNSPLSDSYEDADDLRACLEAGQLDAFKDTAEVIRRFNWGLVDSLDTFKKWIAAVIENNGLSKSGIFFIWDEFTEYVSNSDDQTLLQQLSEFCKVQPFFMTFVVHRTSEMVNRITPKRYQLITHRFHQVEFHISTDAAYDLIAGSIHIRNGMEAHWTDARKPVLNNIRKFLPMLSGLDDKIANQIANLCPIHPMTIKLLARVAENYAAAQRTMFRFMKDKANTDQGFAGYIKEYGPDDQACWLTPEWLWDYFFTRNSDFSDKDTKAAEYIRHFEDSRYLVESDEHAFRVFRTAVLLMALMSSTKGIYSGKKAKDGISATVDCLKSCLCGVMSAEHIDDMLQTMVDSKILVLDKAANDIVRLQLPFKGAGGDEFETRLAQNDKNHTRYKMFSKDGEFGTTLEKLTLDDSDAISRRMKVASCCAETTSINMRLTELKKELEKNPYRLALLLVTVQDAAQANSIQLTLENRSKDEDEARLIIALLKTPLKDETRKEWLSAITKQEMASDNGQSGSANQYKTEATKILTSWVHAVVAGSKIVAFNRNKTMQNLFGMANLRKVISNDIMDKVFPYAPENIVTNVTAYKSCNDAASTAGVSRHSKNSQMINVLEPLKTEKILDCANIDEVIVLKNGSTTQKSIAALAELVKNQMESGQKVNMSDLWITLQQAPYGYYDSIVTGVLLGYIMSFYKNSKYTWIDSVGTPQVLNDANLITLVGRMCKAKLTTDYLSAGTLTWQHFSEYLGKIFNLSVGQLAEQNDGCRNVRETIINAGAPFWVLKYLPKTDWNNESFRKIGSDVVDAIQVFISADGDVEDAMTKVLDLLNGKGKIRVVLAKAFQDRSKMAAAFRTFLFESSPELHEIASKLSIQPEELNDKLRSVMQGAIYTWTEEQVREKLDDVAGQYRYLEAIGTVMESNYHSIDAAKRDIANLFNHLRIPMSAIGQLNPSWYPALNAMYQVAFTNPSQISTEEREAAIPVLQEHGAMAMSCLKDGKAVLYAILSQQNNDCTDAEIATIYSGLKDMSCDGTLVQFNNEIKRQLGGISFARNKSNLLETWHAVSEKDSVRAWCNDYGVPLKWIVSDEMTKAIDTLQCVQMQGPTTDSAVLAAIITFQSAAAEILTNRSKVESAFLSLVGEDYSDLWQFKREEILTQMKLKLGNDMSSWGIKDLTEVQRLLKKIRQEQAKKEKLAGAKRAVHAMKESDLRNRVDKFLDAHPEFCDVFIK